MIYVTSKGNTPVLKTLFSIIWEKWSAGTFYWQLWEQGDPLISRVLWILVWVKTSSMSNSHKAFPFLPQTQPRPVNQMFFLPSSHPQMPHLFIEWVEHFLLSNPNLSDSAVTHGSQSISLNLEQSISVTVAVSPGQCGLVGGHCDNLHEVRDKSHSDSSFYFVCQPRDKGRPDRQIQ